MLPDTPQRYLYRLKDGAYYFQKVFKNYGTQYRVSLKTKKLDVALFRRDEILEKWQEIEWNNQYNALTNSKGNSEGYIYCIGNPHYVGWVKVGRTKNPDERLRVGYNCYTPTDDFYYIIKKKVAYYKMIEKHLIETFSKYCGRKKQKSEWFRTDKHKAIKYFKETINTSNKYILKNKTYTDAELAGVFDSDEEDNNSILKKDLLRNIQSYANR